MNKSMSKKQSIRQNILESRSQRKKADKQDLVMSNFMLLNDLLKHKKVSYGKAFIMIVVGFFFLSLTNLHTYRKLLDLNYPDGIEENTMMRLVSLLSYIDIQEILLLNASFFQIIFFSSVAYVLLLFICYLLCLIQKHKEPKSKPRKSISGKIFIRLTEYYSWVLFFPFVMIFMMFISCDEATVNKIDMNCKQSQLFYANLGFSVFGLLFTALSDLYFCQFFQNGDSQKKDALNSDNPFFMVLFDLYRLGLGIAAAVRTDNYSWLMFYLLLNVLGSTFLLMIIVYGNGLMAVMNQRIRQLFLQLLIFYNCLGFSILFDEISRGQDLFSGTNERIMLFVVIFFLCIKYSVGKYVKYQQYSILKEDIKRIASLNQLKKKNFSLLCLVDSSRDSIFDDTFFKGLLLQHYTEECMHQGVIARCFCKIRTLYDPKKKKDAPTEKCYSAALKSIFCKFMIKSWIEIYFSRHSADVDIYIYYSEFLYNKLRSIPLALKNLEMIEGKFLSPLERYQVYMLKSSVKKGNRRKNLDSYKSRLEIESVLPVENNMSAIKNQIRYVIKNNIKFWEMLEKEDINLSSCNQLLKENFEEIKKLQKLWKEMTKYLEYRKKWSFYYAWFCLYIMNKKVKQVLIEKFAGTTVNENDIFSEDMMHENYEDEIASVDTIIKQEDYDKINIRKMEMAFDKNSCVFHVNDDPRGLILRTNKPALRTFGYNREEIESQKFIANLMPQSLQTIHTELIKNYITSGKTKVIYSQRKVYCIHKQGHCFAAWKFLKQYVTSAGRAEFVALLRPIQEVAGNILNFIIVNDEWEVDAMTKQLHEALMLNAQKYQQNNHSKFNLLILAPKLLKYTRFSKYLTDEDQLFFGIANRVTVNGGQANRMMQAAVRLSSSIRPSAVHSAQFRRPSHIGAIRMSFIDTSDHQLPAPLPIATGGTSPHEQQMIQQNSNKQEGDKLGSGSQMQVPLLSVISPNNNNEQESGNLQQMMYQKYKSDSSDSSQKALMVIGNEGAGGGNGVSGVNGAGAGAVLGELVQQNSLKIPQGSEEVRRSSMQDIQDQLNLFNQAGDVTNEIKKEGKRVENRRRTLLKNQNNQNNSVEEEDNNTELHWNNIEDEEANMADEELNRQGSKAVNEEQDMRDQSRDYRLEKGETIRFVLKVPYNIEALSEMYGRKRLLDLQIQENQNNNSQHQVRVMKTGATSQKHSSEKRRDQDVYNQIKQFYGMFLKKKKVRAFRVQMTSKTRRIGKATLQILRISFLEEIEQSLFSTNIVNRSSNTSPQRENQGKMSQFFQQQQQPQLQQQLQQQQFLQSDAGVNNKEYLQQFSGLSGLSKMSGEDQVANNNNNDMKFGGVGSQQQQQQQNFLNPTIDGGLFSTGQGGAGKTQNTVAGVAAVVGSPIQEEENDSQDDQDSMDEKVKLSKKKDFGYQVKAELKSSNLQTIHKDFDNRQGARNYSLHVKDNIYLKEDNHRPAKKLDSIGSIAWFVRSLFFSMIILNILSFLLGPSEQFKLINLDSDGIYQQENLQLTMLEHQNQILDCCLINSGFYDSVIPATKYTDKKGLEAILMQKLAQALDFFVQLISDESYKKVIYDLSLTEYFKYEKSIFYQNVNMSQVQLNFTMGEDMSKAKAYFLDTYDMVSFFFYHILTIKNKTFDAITATDLNVLFLRENFFPWMNDQFLGIQKNMFRLMQDQIDQIYFILIVLFIILAILLFISLIVLTKLILQVCDSFLSVLEVFPMIQQRDIKKIKLYNKQILDSFIYLIRKDEELSGVIEDGDFQDDEEEQQKQDLDKTLKSNIDFLEQYDVNNATKKVQRVEQGKFLKDIKFKVMSYFIVFCLVASGFSVGFFFMVQSATNYMQQFFDNGRAFIDPISHTEIMMLALKERSLDPKYYTATFKPSVQNIIDQFFSSSKAINIQSQGDSNFDDILQNINQNNPCEMYSYWLDKPDDDGQECQIVALGGLKHGIATFNYNFANRVEDFIKESEANRLGQVTNQDIFEFDRGVYYSNMFMKHAMQAWNSDINNYIDQYLALLVVYIVALIVCILIVYIVAVEKNVVGRFHKEFLYFKSVYKNYMPDAILMKEKRIKFWLIKHNVISK